MYVRLVGGALLFLTMALAAACRNPFGREYEYEEQLYLGVDGSASIVIDSSVPALVSLRGLALDPSPRSRFDPLVVRQLFERAGCKVASVGSPWYRQTRRFVQVRLSVDNIRELQQCGPLAWSAYRFETEGSELHYLQRVGNSAGGNAGSVNWTGGELVAFKLHLPSKVTYHNVRRLEDNSTGEIERGNILTWEQRLTDRQAGAPLNIEIRMEPQSILYRTLWLFVGSFLAAVVTLVLAVAWIVRHGRRRAMQQAG
jgi:hypothetical protein